MTLHVFAGPSLAGSPVLDPAEVCAHPPVAHGDLYRLRLGPGDIVLIVDGVYQHQAPVRHREILSLYDNGVPVFGAASIGALRACELAGHGMTGLGTISAWYLDGRLESDADVALMHGDEEVGFRAFTHALVNILDVTDRLVHSGHIDAVGILDVARSVHFSVRTNAALLAATRGGPLESAMRSVVDELGRHDLKRADAEAAVRDLLARHPWAEPVPAGVPVPDTSYRREWRFQHTPATLDGTGPTKRRLLAYAQLFLPDFPERHTRHVIDHLRLPEDPRFGTGDLAPGWLAGLTPAELIRRGLLTASEVGTLDAAERALRVLVRTFRLRSGRLVYEDVPPGLLTEFPNLADQCAKLLDLTDQAVRTNPRFHPGDIPPDEVEAAFRALWRTDDVRIHLLDRGFRDVEDFCDQARPFFVAARAAVAMTADPVLSRKVMTDVS
ncbi:TfuA-like protein [Actinokineospora sp.]|uniref:TfuA-like protein n=1 Tax=Actinokineospora sp. TaxID=1872133 RepID=UPI0040378FED